MSDGTDLGDVSGNYTALMRERGWSWGDLADEFERQAAQPALDGGAGPRRLARWARTQAEAAVERRAALSVMRQGEDADVWDTAARELAARQRREVGADGEPPPRPDDAAPDAPPRKAVPPRKRTA